MLRSLMVIIISAVMVFLVSCEENRISVEGEESVPVKSVPVIYNIEAGNSDRIGELYLKFTVDTFEGSEVFLTIKGDGEVVFSEKISGTENEYGGVRIEWNQVFNTRVIHSNIIPYHVDVIVSSREDFSDATEYSTDLTFPMKTFGFKDPEGVEKLLEKLEDFVESNTSPFYDYPFYYVDYGEEKFRVSGYELGQKDIMIFSDDMMGGELMLAASYDEPLSEDTTAVVYRVKRYSPPAHYPDMTLEEYLRVIGIDYDSISTDTVIALRPRMFMNIASDEERTNFHPVTHIVFYVIDEDSHIGVGYQDRYFDDNTLSKTPIKRYKYFINGNDIFLVGEKTGNLLAFYIDSEDQLFTKMKVILFSPTFFTGLIPGSEFYERPDAVLIESDWEHPIYNLSEIPDEYIKLVEEAVNEARIVLGDL